MPTRTVSPPTLVQRLATFLRSHPGEWIDGRVIAQVAGSYAWRTRISNLRRPPFNMFINNRQRRVTANGQTFVISEYLFAGERGFRNTSSDAPKQTQPSTAGEAQR